MPRKQKRSVFAVKEIEDPISLWEIDLALSHADKEYAEELNVDLVRTTFNTVQSLREPGIKIRLLVKVVVRENVLEGRNKRVACEGAIMKVYNHRNLVKAASDEAKAEQGLPVRPAVKQTLHPTEFLDGHQRVLF